MKKGIFLLILSLMWSVHTYAQYTIGGPTTVDHGNTYNYVIAENGNSLPTGDITNVTWRVTGGTVAFSSNITARITWDGQVSNGFILVDFMANGEGPYSAYLQVTVNGAPPATPSNPRVQNTGCGQVTLERVGTPPSGTTWYWQGKNANGTSTSLGSGTTFIAKEGSGTYYIRARNSTGWSSGSGSVSVTIPNNLPSVPSAPTITNNCGNTVLTRGTPPSGVTWYWQSSAGGTSTSNASASITRTSGTVYYLRARHNTSGCWSSARTINYTIKSVPGVPSAPTVTNNCGSTVLTRGTPPSGVTWYWQGASSGTSTSNSSVSITRTSGTVYYLRARHNTTGCWSSARTVNYTITQKKTWYADLDKDGFGDPNNTKEACSQPTNYIAKAGDQCPNIPGLDNGCVKEEYTPITLSNENYIYRRTYQKEMADTTGIDYNRDVIESVTYYDGLGRPKQQVAVRESRYMQDIVTHIGYDNYGRQDREYLPFVPSGIGNEGAFRTGDIALLTQKYHRAKYPDDFKDMTDAAVNAYSQKQFEPSPLNRVKKQAVPGKDWKLGNGHEIEFDYRTNTATEVRLFKVSFVNGNTEAPQLSAATNSYYGAGQLYKTITRDENHSGTTKDHTTEEFKDKRGRVVLKRTYNNGTLHDTYYVYDDYGNLTYVIPPKVNTGNTITTPLLNELCYQYKYDERNRVFAKKIPGKGWEYIVYNKLDQPVMTQDANLRTNNQWLFTKYDAFGRVAYTGIKNTTETRNGLQTKANNTSAYQQYVTKTGTANTYAGISVYYNNAAIPTVMDEIHTINYYDTYVATAGLSVPATVYGKPKATNTKGLPTVSKVRVLGTNHWITTITGYDSKGRVIYTASKNLYLNTTDIVEYKLDFTGKVLESKTTHTKGSNPAIVTIDKFAYDHAGRLLTQTQKVNSQAEELIAENSYDPLGQLTVKKVGNTKSKPLQTVNYAYNVRGWLKEINKVDAIGSDLFAFQVHYNAPTHSTAEPLFNGNISQTNWATQSANKSKFWYMYHYDALNRITDAQFGGGGFWDRYSIHGVTYDKNGNIRYLNRRGHINNGATSFGLMDSLDYAYSAGNKLLNVIDRAHKTYGFKDGTNTGNDYSYDGNGNLKTDANKGITGITYNHLNLPTKVTVSNPEHTGNIQYIYGADGTKLKKVAVDNGQTTTTEYAGKYIYENGSLAFFGHPEGYVTKENNTFKYVYQYKDHLGNVRLSYANIGTTSAPELEIIEENNYYPFGLKHKGYNGQTSSLGNSIAQKWKYNGVELEEALGTNLYEMEFRQYDPAIARFTSIDPITHHSQSTYTAFDNNPIFWADPSGSESIYNWDTGQYVINGQVVSQAEAIAYAQNGGNADGSNNNTPDDNQSKQPKYQFFGISPTGEQMNLNFGNRDFNILTGYGYDPEDLRKAKLSAFLGLFKTLSTKDQVNVLRFLKIPSKYWVGILGKVGKVGPGSIMPAYNVYDEGLAALPFGLGALFQPLNDDFNSDARQIENELKWDDVLTGFNEMMGTETLNDVIIIYSNENLFRQSTINTSEAENLSNRHATGNYKYAYYGTQFGNNLHIFGMYLIND